MIKQINRNSCFQQGTLVITKSFPLSTVDCTKTKKTIQAWPGNITKEEWDEFPEHLFVCEYIKENTIGQVVDAHTVHCTNEHSYLLIKILIASYRFTETYWVFSENLSLLHNK